MRKILSVCIIYVFLNNLSYGQCTITNATGCVCANGSNDCDLLPDITISWYALQTYMGGPTEYPQSGAGVDNGRLKVSGSTPNIGYGPFSVQGQDANNMHMFVCGTDTFTAPASSTFTCPNGYPTPKQILWQRIYHKNNNAMTYHERIAGAMTYEQNAMHVDDWGIMTLRLQNPSEPDPRNWSILGTGHKQSFCLMDYGSCTTYNGHCRDDNTEYNQGNILLNGNFPNWGLGNNYGCSPIEQGCSVGYTDIYSENLNGMWINIPPNTCNGDYWIVYEIDPHNYFEESNELNNYTAIPFTLTLQSPPGNPIVEISADKNPVLCGNDSVTLTTTAGFNYLWSDGSTTQSIKVNSGTYSVTVTNYCGTATSLPFVVTSLTVPPAPVVSDDTVCYGTTATFTSSGLNISWYDSLGTLAGTGSSFTTPVLTTTTKYYAQDINEVTGTLTYGGKPDNSGSGAYYTGIQWLLFDALKPFRLKTVTVYANGDGNRTILLLNSSGTLIQSGTFFILNGQSQVNLNFDVPQGTGFKIGVSGNPDLWRNNGGVTYPYTITDTLSITGSTGGANFYYFFYNWQIEIGGGSCTSPVSWVTAVVENCTGIDENIDLAKNISVYPNPFSGIFTLEIIMPGSGEEMNIQICDMVSRKMYREDFLNISGKYSKTINLSKIQKGIYQLTIEIAGKKYNRKIICL